MMRGLGRTDDGQLSFPPEAVDVVEVGASGLNFYAAIKDNGDVIAWRLTIMGRPMCQAVLMSAN